MFGENGILEEILDDIVNTFLKKKIEKVNAIIGIEIPGGVFVL